MGKINYLGNGQQDAQNPVSINIDRVYASDIDMENSDNGDFSGAITDYFDDLHSVNSNVTTDNPKTIKVWFKGSQQIYTIAFGCNTTGKSFSNVKIKLFGSDETIREIVDNSTDDTKYNSLTLDFAPEKANGVIIEFHTADEICLSNIVIWKATNTISQIVAVDEITNEVSNVMSRDGNLNVSPEFKKDLAANYYLYRVDATPTITTNTSIGDTVININSNAGITNGEAITFYEGESMFQSLVVSSTATTVTIGSGLDYAFTTAAEVESGPWNMVVDGSVTPQLFQIKSPPAANLHIHTVNGTILDQTDMDDAKFGGITGLTNGIIYQYVNGVTKQIALIVNNIGFYEFGFEIAYSDKAPAGFYGFRFRVKIPEINGIILELGHANRDEFQLIIRDNLTALDQLSSIVIGHIVPY